MKRFRSLIIKEDNELLPQIGRFWGEEDEEEVL
jgi:hypothetical protein